MTVARSALILLLLVPLAAGQGQPVEDGEQVEILRVSNPYSLTLDEPFELQVTLRNHLDHDITVGLFATLHTAGSGCRGGEDSYSEVTQRRTPDGKVNYIHETVRLDAGQTLSYPTGEDWQGVILEENGLPASGAYELCYWIESPTKSETDEEGNLKPVYPWFYDRHAVPVQVDLDTAARIRVDAPELRSAVASDVRFTTSTTIHNPFSESVLVRLSGALHAADTDGCAGDALAHQVVDTLEVRVPGVKDGSDGTKTVSILPDGSPWEGMIPAEKIAGSGQYILCLTADPVQSQRDGDVQGTTLYVRKDNAAPTGILEPGITKWGPGDEIPFHMAALDADGDPVRIVWDFTGSRAVVGPEANFTVPYLGTFQLTITLDDGFEETRLVCLIPVPGDQTTEDNAIHGCLVEPPQDEGFSIPAPGPLAALFLVLAWAGRRRQA